MEKIARGANPVYPHRPCAGGKGFGTSGRSRQTLFRRHRAGGDPWFPFAAKDTSDANTTRFRSAVEPSVGRHLLLRHGTARRGRRGARASRLASARPGQSAEQRGGLHPTRGGRILLVYTHFTGGGADHSAAHRGKRTPYNVAVSRDEGRTWQHVKTLEDDPDGWYCYTAVEFVGDHVLLAHCAGNRKTTGGLATTQITRFPLEWLYE